MGYYRLYYYCENCFGLEVARIIEESTGSIRMIMQPNLHVGACRYVGTRQGLRLADEALRGAYGLGGAEAARAMLLTQHGYVAT